MSREKSIKTININLEKLTALELEEVTVLTNALLAVRNVREEHQAKISGYTEEIQRLEYKAKEFQESAELTSQEVHKLRDANKQLKSQLEKQQPEIPEVPQFVADWYEENKDSLDYMIYETCRNLTDESTDEFENWFGYDENKAITTLVHMKNGYTVAKEERFYLKNKLTGLYLRSYTGMSMDDTTLRFEEVSDNRACGFGGGTQFNQQEIDSMAADSYEKIEVEE